MVYQASGFQWFSQKRPMTNVFDLWWAVEVAMFTLHFASRSGLTSIVMHFKMFRDIATWLNIKIKHFRFCKCPTTIPQNRLRVEPLISYITCTIYASERENIPMIALSFFGPGLVVPYFASWYWPFSQRSCLWLRWPWAWWFWPCQDQESKAH